MGETAAIQTGDNTELSCGNCRSTMWVYRNDRAECLNCGVWKPHHGRGIPHEQDIDPFYIHRIDLLVASERVINTVLPHVLRQHPNSPNVVRQLDALALMESAVRRAVTRLPYPTDHPARGDESAAAAHFP